MNILEQLKIIVVGLRVTRVLRLLSLLQLISHCTLHFRYVQDVRLIMPEDIILLMNDFGSVDIIPLQSLQKALIKFRLVNRLKRCKLEVGIFLGKRAQLPPLDNSPSALQRRDINRAIDNFCHLFDILLELVVWIEKLGLLCVFFLFLDSRRGLLVSRHHNNLLLMRILFGLSRIAPRLFWWLLKVENGSAPVELLRLLIKVCTFGATKLLCHELLLGLLPLALFSV